MKIKFKRDTAFRKQFFVPDSFAHPAKMDAQLLIWIVEHYTETGETILDPMAGSGTTMLACTLGRNVVLVELEPKFISMCYRNWARVGMNPRLGYLMGLCHIFQGDARQLEGLLCDKIITSPPYADIERRDRSREARWDEEREKEFSGGSVKLSKGYQVDRIVTSPPYEGMKQDDKRANDPEQIDKRAREFEKAGGDFHTPGRLRTIERHYAGYASSSENIGNLKSQSYLEAMLQVYQQCYKVLKPEGLMILVTKNFIRNKQVVRLDEDTIKLCEQAGFSFVERHYRELPSQSFWRIIYHQRHPEVEQIKSEDILIFRK